MLVISKMPFAPIQGGSFTVSTVGSAIKAAGKGLRKKLFKHAKNLRHSPFSILELDDVIFENGSIVSKKEPSNSISLLELIEANKGKVI